MIEVNHKIQRYESYKNSGIEWLGEIPEQWEIESFKNILTERNEKNAPVKTKEILSLSIDKGVTLYAEKTTNLDRFKDDFSKYKLAHKGDLVFNSMNMIVGAVGVSDYFGCVSPVYYTYHGDLNNPYTTKFYEYLFRSKTVQGVLYSLGKGLMAIDRGDGKYNTLRLKVSRDDLRSMKLPLPNIAEQTLIVDYLDDKTTKIEEAITIKKQQISLLKERKQILIHKAVTRGLDDSVNLKDSGVEWIGEIPEHWEVLDIRRVTIEHKQGYYSTEAYVEDGIKLLRITDFRKDGNLETAECPMVKGVKEVYNYILIPGDFVFARTGGAGNFAIFPNSEEKIAFASYLIRFRFDLKRILKDYLKYYFNSPAFMSGVERNIHGGVNQNIHAEDIKAQKITLPPIKEQLEIAKQTNLASQKIETAINLKQQEIAKLKEYKSSLINSVVTGKVKVC